MTTSGTYTFNPSIGELILSAFARIQIRRPNILQEHIADAQKEANFALASFSNRGPNLWAVDLQTVTLSAGIASYSIPAETVMVLSAYITTTSGGVSTDIVITPLSRDEYASLPNKATQGFPTSFWLDRLVVPTISLWPVPDNTQTYTLNYYRYRQLQDANTASGQNIDLQYLFLDAFVAELAYRLARIYAPALEAQRKVDAAEAWQIAATQNVENVPMSIIPGLSSYFR